MSPFAPERWTIACAIAVASCASSAPPPSDGASTFPAAALTTADGPAGAHVELRTAPSQPPPRGVIDVQLTITDRSGKPVDGATIGAVPWMPAHGHGASTTPTLRALGGGRYLVHDVNLFMPGRWELRLTIDGPITDHVEPTIDVP
ncbi:MAG: hypothetical protein NVSMB47_09370 [Polyangiales bacterium]